MGRRKTREKIEEVREREMQKKMEEEINQRRKHEKNINNDKHVPK